MPQNTASERGNEARRKLLVAAAELIPELGWKAVSTRTLAERAGVRTGLVHYHFDSLQALLQEASLQRIRVDLAELEQIVHPTIKPTDGIATLLAAFDDFTGMNPEAMLLIEAYLAATRDARFRSELTKIVTEFADTCSAWLEAWGDNSPRATAAVLTAALDGVLLHRALNPELDSLALTPVLHRLLTTTDAPSVSSGE